jgi:hypothetical protein
MRASMSVWYLIDQGDQGDQGDHAVQAVQTGLAFARWSALTGESGCWPASTRTTSRAAKSRTVWIDSSE